MTKRKSKHHWRSRQNKDLYFKKSKKHGFRSRSTFKLKDDQEIQLSGHFSTKMKLTTGEISPMKMMDFAYKKEVDEKFNITLKVKDIFKSRGFHIITNQDVDYDDDTVNQFMEADFRRNKRTISLSFEYKFGEFKKKKYISTIKFEKNR